MHIWVVATTTLLALLFPVHTDAISYRCENNQVLIVQSFGNDTIRMHCQKLNLCGYQNLRCNYDREQPSCGGKNNFVSHVNQVTPTGPVTHVCCELQHNSALSVPNHDGNDCFVYELPDGSSKDPSQGRTRKQHSVDEDEQLTVLQNAAQIPEQIDGISGYRMKLFMLRNKSPPSLIVKAIERLPDGYRVTICRPRCGNFAREGEIGRNEKTVKAPVVNGGDIMHGKVQSPAEWAAASWSAWSSSSWSSWSTSKLVGETSAEAKARGQIRGDRTKNEEGPNGGEDKRWGSGWNSGRSEGSGWPTGGITNNVNVHAVGGAGGLGGEGGQGKGGAVSGVHGGNAGAVAIANGSGAGVGVVAIDGGGDGALGKAKIGKNGSAGGDGTAGGENANGGLGGNSGNGSEGPDGDAGKAKAGGRTPDGDGTDEGDNGKGSGNGNKGKGNNGSGEGGNGADNNGNGNGKKPIANGNGNGVDSSESGGASGPNGDNSGKGKGNGSSEAGASPDDKDKNNGGKGNGGKDDKATMIMEPDGGVEAVNKVEEEGTPKGAGSGNGGEGDGNGKGDNGEDGNANKNGDGTSPDGSGNGLGGGDGDGNGGPGKVKVISGPSHLSSEKPDGDGNNGAGDGSGGDNGDKNGDGKGKDNGDGNGNNNKNDGNNSNEGNNKNGNNNAGDGNGGDGNGGFDKNANPNGGDASGQGKSGEGNGGPNGNRDGKNSGNGNKPDGAAAGAGGPDGNGNNNGDGTANGNKGGDGSPDGTDGNGANANNGENAGSDGTGDGGAGGNKKGSDEVEGSGEGSGADVTSAEFENGPGENPARPAGGSGEGGDGNGNGNNGGTGTENAGNGNGAGGDKGTGTEGGNGNAGGNTGGNNGNNGGSITPAEENNAGGAGIAADPGVGGGSDGGGIGAAPPVAGFGGLGGGLMACFSGDMQVTTVTGAKRMDELEIGDLVLVPASGNLLKYEKVEMFYHREPETTARFVQINTESGKSLTLTSLHLLPFDDCDALNEAHLNIEDVDTFMRQSKFAHKATPGQCVISVTPSGTLNIDRIISVNRRVSKGIYSPMTVEGSLIANGILSSCFSQLESHAVQKLAYDALVGIYNVFGYLQDAIVEPTQEIPSMLNYIHQLSRFVLPFSKY